MDYLDHPGRFADSPPVSRSLSPAALREACGRARQAWPELSLSSEAFAERLAVRAVDAELDALHIEDLYLAAAAAEGEARAVALIEERYLAELGPVLAPFEAAGIGRDEVVQVLRVHLFTHEGERPPRIAGYGGLADLRTWLKVVATRLAISLGRKHRRERPLGDAAFTGLPDQAPSPELALLHETYRAEFRAAFAAAFAALTPRERNLIRHQVLDQLGIDRIGALYGVHRATAARWVARAQDALVRGVRRELKASLQVGPGDLDSILRLVASHIDLSSRAFLSQP
jgi:RNA polymerase sigma-70 factor, ECF subfamily